MTFLSVATLDVLIPLRSHLAEQSRSLSLRLRPARRDDSSGSTRPQARPSGPRAARDLGSRRARILAPLVAARPGRRGTRRLCEVGAEVTAMTGAGIMLMFDDLPNGSVCSTDEVSALIERLQFDLGEGPCIDAHQRRPAGARTRSGRAVTIPMAAFAPPAVAAGARAVFGFPLRIGAMRLGALEPLRGRARRTQR